MDPEEEAFVKELAHQAKDQHTYPRVTPRTNTGQQNAPHRVGVSTKVGIVWVLPEEKKRLEELAAREGKSPIDLINQYL
jgi:hypothetical protein